MKGKTRTNAEIKFQNRVAQIGCIVCLNNGIENYEVSIHHIDGRTRPEAHRKVLPLCHRHHQLQDNETSKRWYTLHANKAEFERNYGSQYDLLNQCMELI